MNLNHLAIFHAVAQCGSVSAGAERLHISQSAVSKQLTEFERRQNLTLFERLPRGVRLTEAGQLLYGYANRLFAIQSEAESALADLQRLARGQLTIGASRTIGGYLLPARLAAFRRLYPDVAISLQVENTSTTERKLIAGELDIGFTEGIVNSAQLHYRVFARDELVLIAAPGHPILQRQPVPLSALGQYPLLMHEEGSGTRAVTESVFAERRLNLRPDMTLASSEAIKQTVATGVGLALISSAAIRSEVEAGLLCTVKVKGLHVQRELFLVQLRTGAQSPALAAFLQLFAN